MKHIATLMIILSFVNATGVNVFDKFDFLNLSIAPYVQSVGETGVVSAKGPESVYFNPALGAKRSDHSALIGTTLLGYDQQVFYGYYRFPVVYRGSLLYLGIVSYQMSGIELRRRPTDAPDSILNATQTMLSGGISRYLISNVSFGLNANLIIDNFSKSGMSFLFGAGLAWFPKDDILLGWSGKYLGDGQFLSSIGIQWAIDPIWTVSSQIDLGASEGFFEAQTKCGIEYKFNDTTAVQVGYHSQMLSVGLRQSFESLGIQVSYTDTPIGSRYSFGIELL